MAKCDPIRAEVAKLEKQLKKIRKFEIGPDGKPHINPDFTEKQNEIRAARVRLKKCEGAKKAA